MNPNTTRKPHQLAAEIAPPTIAPGRVMETVRRASEWGRAHQEPNAFSRRHKPVSLMVACAEGRAQ